MCEVQTTEKLTTAAVDKGYMGKLARGKSWINVNALRIQPELKQVVREFRGTRKGARASRPTGCPYDNDGDDMYMGVRMFRHGHCQYVPSETNIGCAMNIGCAYAFVPICLSK